MRIQEVLKDVDPRLLSFAEGRREVCRLNPMLFAAIYFPHKLKHDPEQSDIFISEFHQAIAEHAKSWAKPGTNPSKNCWIAPRQIGKSTWDFHILPIWAGAYGHKKYALCFSNSVDQAQGWLRNFQQELETNELLRNDFPEFCDTFKLTKGGKAFADNRNITIRGNGFVFQAKGADSAVLGTNINGVRPDLLLFDDIEPDESNYSTYEANKRLNTLLQSHFYLNTFATVEIIGTTTMPDSIIDQIRKVGEAKRTYEGDESYFRDSLDPQYRWVVDNHINVHYFPAIIEEETGERSLWPEVWPMDKLNEDRHTRSFAMNMMNRPISTEGGYWNEEDIQLDDNEYAGQTILAVDPAVVTKRANDDTGIAVLSYGPDGTIYVRHAEGVKLAADELAIHVEKLVQQFGVDLVYVESNQGGDLWKQVFKNSSVRVSLHRHNSGNSKEHRASQAFDLYKKGRIKHVAHFPKLEEQMLIFPKGRHDDVLDAVVNGVLLMSKKRRRVEVKQSKYMEV